MEIKASEIQHTLLILCTLGDAIEAYYNILEKESNDKESITYSAVSSQMLLMANSFKVEWKRFSKLEEDRARIIKVGTITKPFRKQIDQWTDLENVRNIYIAHNFRDSSDNYCNRLLKPYNRELKIPNEFPDYALLYRCTKHINLILLGEFMAEWNDLILKLSNLKRPVLKKGASSLREAAEKLKELIKESDGLKEVYPS